MLFPVGRRPVNSTVRRLCLFELSMSNMITTSMKTHPSSLLTLVITAAVWLIMVIGCSSGTQPRSGSSTDPRVEYKHGSKIVVHYNPQQNKTFFSQGDIKISPDINIGTQKVTGKHSFEIDITAESSGKGSLPNKVTLTLMHDTPTKTGWRYPRNPKFVAVADSLRFELTCAPSARSGNESNSASQCIQSDSLKKDNPSDADYYEALFMDIPFQTFVAIGNSKSLKIEIGGATLILPSDTIAALHDFAETMTQK